MAKMNTGTTTKHKVAIYEATVSLIDGLYNEIRELSKKKPDATLNVGKVTLINRLLADVKQVLNDEPEGKYLDLLDEEAMPQYSDVVLILSQFTAAMKAFSERYYVWNGMEHRWSVGN